ALDAALPGAPGAVAPLAPVSPARAAAAARTLALASAAQRATIEARVAAGDEPAVTALQRERIAAAAALVRAAINGAWFASVAPPVPVAGPVVRAFPNPVRDAAVIAFAAPVAGDARLELFDLAGRRLVGIELGHFQPGPHQVALHRERLGPIGAGVYY